MSTSADHAEARGLAQRLGIEPGQVVQLVGFDSDCDQSLMDDVVARTVRTRLLAIAGRIINRSGKPTLRMPTHWPWANTFTTALTALRALHPPPG